MTASSSGEEKKKIKRVHAKPEPEVDPEFQIAPMIDILLVLLVFFMSISTTEVLQASANLTLPIAKDAKEPQKNPGQVIVNVTVNPITQVMGIEVDQKNIPTPAMLGDIISQKLSVTPNMRVLIRADRHVRFEYMRTILEVIGGSGVGNITFAVADKEG